MSGYDGLREMIFSTKKLWNPSRKSAVVRMTAILGALSRGDRLDCAFLVVMATAIVANVTGCAASHSHAKAGPPPQFGL